MAHQTLPFYNASYGVGIEGFLNYSNSLVSNWFIPTFLFVFYGLSIYLLSKSEWKLGGSIAFASVLFFILAMIAQTFTTFNQLTIFIFIVGIIVGIVLSFIENARS
jgi:prepilin signal peptidase PulO-like enzyme (type II secretory pathway)